MNLGERLKEERERLGYNQTDFAALAGASKHSQINWEKGSAAPNATALNAWAAIGLDVLYVVTGVRPYPTQHQSQHAGLMAADPGASYGLKPEERALLDNYRAAAPEGQKALRDTSAALAKSAGCVKKSG